MQVEGTQKRLVYKACVKPSTETDTDTIKSQQIPPGGIITNLPWYPPPKETQFKPVTANNGDATQSELCEASVSIYECFKHNKKHLSFVFRSAYVKLIFQFFKRFVHF